MPGKKIRVGKVEIGGGAPVSVQSMCNTKTEDVEAALSQIGELKEAGCEIVRLAVPNMEAARAISAIKERSALPIVADIHFDYRLAIEAVNAGADKIRINPGNIGGDGRVKAVADACREKGVPIRVGVNGGSLEKDLLEKYGRGPQALAESALRNVSLLNRFDFDNICISAKASDVKAAVETYRLIAGRTDYPLHIGVTEAGTEYTGLIRSAVGIGSLLLDGIGDTLRVSLTADPVKEVQAGIAILKAVGLRRDGINLISCPSCGRCNIDLIRIAGEVEERLAGVQKDITVAVMGCAVNGPGEARAADYGIAGGDGMGVLFSHGEKIKSVPMESLVDALIDMITDGD